MADRGCDGEPVAGRGALRSGTNRDRQWELLALLGDAVRIVFGELLKVLGELGASRAVSEPCAAALAPLAYGRLADEGLTS